jgi:nicotinamidase-related amidase
MFPIDIRAYKCTDEIPLLILVDPQQEYLCETRPLGLSTAPTAFENCRLLLKCARENRFPVAFVRWSQDGKVFNRNCKFSSWADGCVPNGSDMVFERSWPSCYTSREFSEMMSHGGGLNAVIAGFTGAIACLATIVEGVPKEHRYTFIHDASASHGHYDRADEEMHELATSLISVYATVTTTDGWLNAQAIRGKTRTRGLSTHAIG